MLVSGRVSTLPHTSLFCPPSKPHTCCHTSLLSTSCPPLPTCRQYEQRISQGATVRGTALAGRVQQRLAGARGGVLVHTQ